MLAGAITRSGSPVVPIEILGVAYLATIDTGFNFRIALSHFAIKRLCLNSLTNCRTDARS